MREGSPPLEETFPVLGTLTLLRRKTGEVAQTFPIDAERITFGRDYDCDVRLYLQDVSKIHAEILFNSNRQATLLVHGTNGVIHTPAGGKAVQLKAPSQVELSDGDTFAIRKKLFRFTYGEPLELPTYMSPMVQRTMPATPGPEAAATPARRRASMRLSIVPEGKRFVPSPAKPRASGFTGNGATPSKTPAKSSLSKTVELEAPEEYDELLAVEEGDEGDKLFLERKEEENAKPVYHNPFMTPQPQSKIQMRNTSAVPRTRKLQFALPGEATEPVQAPADVQVEEPPASPATPTSIPLPPPSDTPYSLPMTPVRLPVPAISAQLAHSAPRGPMSLFKSVVVRNGWRAELDSQPKGIDAEIAKGHIETRRRRSSSGLSNGRKSLSPKVPEPESDSSSECTSDDDKENTPASPASLKWVYENGMEETSQLDDSDSDGGSFENDLSIPGQGLIDFDAASGASVSGSEGEFSDEVEEEDEQSDEGEENALSEEEEMEDISSEIDDEVDSSNVIDPASLSRERSTSPVLPARYYATSPTRPGLGSPRLSLSSIGGPPVRFTPQPAPRPSYGGGFPMTPTGKLGPPTRALRTPVPSSQVNESDTEEEEAQQQLVVPATPRTPKLPNGGLSKAQREALGTPRDLPAPPPSFRNPAPTPVKQGTPSLHRVFEPTAAELAYGIEPPRTPFEDIKRRLSALRLGAQTSAKKRQFEAGPRRATVGFALPETPSKEASSSARPLGSTRRPVPATPRVAAIDEGESESLPATPTAANVEAAASLVEEATPKHKRRRSLVSPSLAGIRDMLKTPKEPKTPSMAGMRSMFKTPKAITSPQLDGVREMYHEPKHVRTPSFRGLRNLLKEPEDKPSPSLVGVKELMREEKVPPTPAMSGIKEMFAQREVPPTPAFDGVAEMYEADEPEVQIPERLEAPDEEEAEEVQEAEVEAEEEEQRAVEVKKPTRRTRTAEASEPSSPDKPATRTRSRLPTRAAKAESAPTRATKSTVAEDTVLKPTKTTRRKPDAVSEPVRRSTRAKSSAPTTSEDETKSAPTRKRTTRSATVEIENRDENVKEAKSEPVRRSKRAVEEKSEPVRKGRAVKATEEAEIREKKTRAAAGKSGIAVPARVTRSRKA